MGMWRATRPAASAALTAALVAALAGCGGGSGLKSDDPHEMVQAWVKISCGDNDVNDLYGAEENRGSPYADLAASASCVREDANGTLMQKKQLLLVFTSHTALATHLSQFPCPSEAGYVRVNGETWTATTHMTDLANDLVEAGGTLCT